jgi:hypothetical protein
MGTGHRAYYIKGMMMMMMMMMMIKFYSIQFFIIYVPRQQLQGQLHKQHSVDTSNYIMSTQHKIKV